MENVGGVIDRTVEVLDQLRGTVCLFALSNWPAETAADLTPHLVVSTLSEVADRIRHDRWSD
jgi:hypothetical protein